MAQCIHIFIARVYYNIYIQTAKVKLILLDPTARFEIFLFRIQIHLSIN